LLHVLTQAAREARYLVVYVSCGATANFDETFRAVAAAVPLMFHEDFGPTSPQGESGSSLATLLGPEPVTARLASDLCARVVGTRVLVVLDEFDRCESGEFRRNVAEFLKNLSDRSVRVQLIIAGVAGNLEELIEPGAMIQRNVVAVEVPGMAPGELDELIGNGQAVSGLTFDDDALTILIAAANGLPYLASLLSQHAGLAALTRGSREVTSNDVRTAISQALSDMKGRVSRRALGEIARHARDGLVGVLGPLSGLAQLHGGGFGQSDITEHFTANPAPDAPDAATARRMVEALAESGVLIEPHTDDFGNEYRFTDQNISPFLWLLSAEARFGAPTAPRRGRMAVADGAAASVPS
jgi:hypothetical protein